MPKDDVLLKSVVLIYADSQQRLKCFYPRILPVFVFITGSEIHQNCILSCAETF